MKVLFAGGGTGGHLFPGLAVAEELRARGVALHFAGTRRGIEARVVGKAGYPLSFIDIEGLKGRGLRALLSALRWPRAIVQTLRLLRRERPDVVVGVGGYASGPVVLLAHLLGLPTAILEQNSVPGVTNRILGRRVDRIFTAFPEAGARFPPDRVRLLGNPIRSSLIEPRPPSPSGRGAGGEARTGTILVLGGSQGAHAVNELVAAAAEHLARSGRPVPRLVHQSGPADAPGLQARYAALDLPAGQVQVVPFIEDMAAAYAAADLVIGRAGATTLAELTALGLPAILIPFPYAADDHQTRNARSLEAAGAAEVLVQAEARPEDLAERMLRLAGDPSLCARMAESSRALGRPHAARHVAEELLALVAARA